MSSNEQSSPGTMVSFLSLRRRSSTSLLDEMTSEYFRNQISPPIPGSNNNQTNPLGSPPTSSAAATATPSENFIKFKELYNNQQIIAPFKVGSESLPPLTFSKEPVAPIDRMEKKIMAGQFTDF